MYFKKRKLKDNNNKKTDISHLSFLSIKKTNFFFLSIKKSIYHFVFLKQLSFLSSILKNPTSLLSYLKKSLSLFLSISILYSQLFFSIFITQTIANIVIRSINITKSNNLQLSILNIQFSTSVYANTSGENSNSQYNPNHSLNNIQDNPINHIEVDNSRGQGNTHLDRAENGTPIVNINSATQGGVSANYYKDFNVNNENLILNNYQGNTTNGQAVNTNLGGVIYSNPNMNQPNSREANIILNEITTNRQTRLEGYLEVAGKKADVIIANPNGIMVSGGGFINTSKLSLITGSSGACPSGSGGGSGSSNNCGTLDSNGNLNPFQLSNNPNAIIQIVGRNLQDKQGKNIAYNLGIDATNQDYLGLISRVVQINGDIIGNTNTQLDIKTGNDKATFNSNTNTFDEITNDTAKGIVNKPEFAIDSTALGGIYAGRINIIATEQGVGTRIRSDVVASVDDINFDVNGNIIIKDANIQTLNQNKNINIKNQNKKLQQAEQQTEQQGQQQGQQQTEQQGPQPNYQEYTLELDNSNLNANKIDIATNNLINKNNSTIYATTKTKINATNTITNNTNSNIYANQLIDLQTINLNNINNSLIYSSNELKINLTGNLLNQNNSSIGTDNKLTIIAGISTDTTNTGNITNNNNSLITSGNIFNLSANNLTNNTNSTIYSLNNLNINTNLLNNSNNGYIFANNNLNINTNLLNNSNNNNLNLNNIINTNGKIESNGNITISTLTDFITQGIIKSTAGTTTINAKNITISNNISNNTNLTSNNISNNTNLTSNNLILNANGNITNNGISPLQITNDLIFNILKDDLQGTNSNLYKNSGNLYNYGIITAGNNATIYTENSVYNGRATEIGTSQSTISAGNLYIEAEQRIMNYGFLQAVGIYDSNNQKIAGTGNFLLKTNAEINSDYKLNNTNTTGEDITQIQPIPPDAQARIDVLDTITDFYELNTLSALAQSTNNEDIYYSIQKRMRLLKITDFIDDVKEQYEYEENNFKIGNQTTAESENDDGDVISTQIIVTESMVQDQLQYLLGSQYNPDDWQIDLSLIEQQIDQNIQAQQNRLNAYNHQKRQLNPAHNDLTLDQFIQRNPTTEHTIDREQLLQQAFQVAEQQRLVAIGQTLNDKKQVIQTYSNLNWNALTEDQLRVNLSNLFVAADTDFDATKYSIKEFSTTTQQLNEYQQYLEQLRTDNKNQTSLEKTGIHNYGRLYSNNDITLISKSILHNNNNSLIYSNNNINFNIDQVLFNNAGGTNTNGQTALGYGIFANNNISINGYNGEVSRLNQLINYNGRIEANNNINIKTNETINYGSDAQNIYADPYSGAKARPEDYGMPCRDCGIKMYEKIFYDSILKSNSSVIQSNNGELDIDSRDSIINYNSTLYTKNSLRIKTPTLLNTSAEFQVEGIEKRVNNYKKRRWQRVWRYKYYTDWLDDQKFTITLRGNTKARIVSGGNVSIDANTIINGSLTNDATKTNQDKKNEVINESANGFNMPTTNNLPYSTQDITQSQLDKITNNHTIDPTANISLPTNNYGLYRRATTPQSHFLFETDPLLTDATRFLGSQYFMNRIGLDPFSVDQKFLGDAFMEHEMIRRSLEQISLFQNTHISDDEIDVYIDNLYKTLDTDKVQQYNLEFGKELTASQINSLEEDIVWYVEKEITLPSKDKNGNYEVVKALVPQVYLSQNSVNRLTNNTDELLKLQAELSIKQATDTAIIESTNAGNKAVSDKIKELDNQAQQEAKTQAKNDAQNNVNTYLSDLQLNNPKQYNQTIQDIISTLDKTKEVKNTPCTKTTNSCYQTQPKSQNELLAEAKTTLNKQLYEQTIAELEQQYYNEIKTAKLNDFTQPIILIDDTGALIKTLSKQEQLYQNTYNNTYPLSYNTALAKAEEQNKAKADTSSLIAGNNVTIQSLDPTKTSVLNNSGTIQGNRKVVITTDQINNSTSSIGGNQATITAGELVYLNTIQYKTDDKGNYQLDDNGQKIALSSGIINNNSGLIGTTGANSTTYIATGELNNITNSQREEYKTNNYEKTETHIGTTSQIASNGNLIIDTTGNLNLKGSSILAKGNIDLNIQGDLNSSVVENYNREYQKITTSGGTFGTDKSKETETISLTNLASYITSTGGSINTQSTNINLQNTHIDAEQGMTLIAKENINLTTALDYFKSYTKETKDNTWTGGSIDINMTEIGTNQSTTLNSNNGNINLIAGNNITSISGKFTTQDLNQTGTGNINLLAGYELNEQGQLTKSLNDNGTQKQGSISLLSAQDFKNNYSYHEEWDGALSMMNPANINISIDNRGFTASTSYEQSLDENSNATKTSKVGTIESAGNLNIQASGGNISSIGTQIYADKNINLKADTTIDENGNKTGGNILLTSANNSQTTDIKHEETKVTVGVKVGNAYVDAVNAGDAVVKAGEKVKDANDELKRIENLYEQGKASKEAVNDAKTNVAMASVNLLNTTIAFTSSVAGAATAASTSFGTGMYASAFANYDTTQKTSTKQDTYQTQSNIQSGNGNISFTSANDMLQEGTNIYATNGTLEYDITNDLTIKASKDTSISDSKTEHLSAGASIGNNSVQVNVGGGETSSKTRSTTYNNSEVLAENIIIKTANNTTISAANITATNTLTADIGNNLTIESLQDTYYSKSNSWDANLSIGSSGAGGEFNLGKDNTDSAWVNNQTTLTAGNSVDIKVGTREEQSYINQEGNKVITQTSGQGKTTITGAVIASGQYTTDKDGNTTFKDNGNLSLTTKELAYNDLNDFSTSNSKGFGLQTNSSTSTLTLKSIGEEQTQDTKATIGNGNIAITGQTQNNNSNLLSGLNRDVNNSQKTTKDQITGALDGNMSVDNRILSLVGGNTNGVKDIGNNFVNLGGNTAKALTGSTGTIINTLRTTSDLIFDSEINLTDTIDNWKGGQTNLVDIVNMSKSENRQVLNNLSEGQDINDIQNATNGKANIYYNENDNVYGFYDIDTREDKNQEQQTQEGQNGIYLNGANETATNTETFMTTYGHENSHQYTDNENVANSNGSFTNSMWELSNLLHFDSVNTTGGATTTSWIGQQMENYGSANTLINNTISASKVENREDRTIVKPLKDLNGNKIKDKYIVIDAEKDGNTDILDVETKITLLKETIFDDEFIMYGSDNLEKGVAKGYVIHFDIDITGLVDEKVEQAKNENPLIWGYKSKSNGEYDIKKSLGDYTGYVYDNKITTGRGAGNILFGRNMEQEEYMPNFVIEAAAGWYNFQGLSNKQKLSFIKTETISVWGETNEAVKHYQYGAKQQENIKNAK
ncbi:MAG: hypothetical protein Ta2D_07260 [Rickettsiales bacterium]|nr:MAG: hypothetical protein Ta2D_07260 [Rickettsiales bacterium]